MRWNHPKPFTRAFDHNAVQVGSQTMISHLLPQRPGLFKGMTLCFETVSGESPDRSTLSQYANRIFGHFSHTVAVFNRLGEFVPGPCL